MSTKDSSWQTVGHGKLSSEACLAATAALLSRWGLACTGAQHAAGQLVGESASPCEIGALLQTSCVSSAACDTLYHCTLVCTLWTADVWMLPFNCVESSSILRRACAGCNLMSWYSCASRLALRNRYNLPPAFGLPAVSAISPVHTYLGFHKFK